MSTEYIKKIGKTGNSMQVTIPKEAQNFGFELGIEVKLTLENNKIVIEPQEKKTEYYSRIKGFYYDNDVIRPSWNNTNKSTRFQELNHYFNDNPGGYDLKLYFDHNESKYMAFICSNNSGSFWLGYYITEDDYKALEQDDKNAWHILEDY